MTALAKEPSHRFQNAAAFRKALQNVKEQQSAAQAATLPYSSVRAPANSAQNAATHAAPADYAANESQRSLRMGADAVTCVGVLAGAVVFVPHFWKTLAANRAVVSKSGGESSGQHSLPPTFRVREPARSSS